MNTTVEVVRDELTFSRNLFRIVQFETEDYTVISLCVLLKEYK